MAWGGFRVYKVYDYINIKVRNTCGTCKYKVFYQVAWDLEQLAFARLQPFSLHVLGTRSRDCRGVGRKRRGLLRPFPSNSCRHMRAWGARCCCGRGNGVCRAGRWEIPGSRLRRSRNLNTFIHHPCHTLPRGQQSILHLGTRRLLL